MSKLARHSILISAFAIASILISYLYFDSQLAHYFKTPALEQVYYYSREITNIGLSVHYFVIAIALYVIARWIYPRWIFLQNKFSLIQKEFTQQWSLQLLKSLILVGIAMPIIKFCVGRQRPHLTAPDYISNSFNHFTVDWHWHSFPSGHSQVLFTVATVLLLIWPKQKYYFLALAAIFALTRVTIQQHFLSDVIGGAWVAYLGTLWIYEIWPPKVSQKKI